MGLFGCYFRFYLPCGSLLVGLFGCLAGFCGVIAHVFGLVWHVVFGGNCAVCFGDLFGYVCFNVGWR